jgi:Uncharacterized protein conserved in bacteria
LKIAQIFRSKIMYSLIALLLTVFLFVYVNSEHLSGNEDQSQISTSLMKNTRATIKKEPNLSYNNDKYYVSGVPQNVKVSLIGPSGLVKAAENTGNFQVVADLNGLKPGTHTINLKTSGLSSEISARTDPEKIKVKISKKGQASFPVQVRYDSNKIAKEYAAGVANSNRQSVKVTGARTDIKKIESVVADVNLSDNVKKSVSRNVLLRAIDENGKQLDVTISPETARVNVPIYLASSHKKVPLRLVSGGQGVDGKKYDFSTDTKYVTLTGTKDALKKIDELKVPVSLAGVDADEDRTISLVSDRSGITAVSPETIQVHIDVKSDAKSSSSSGSSSTSETTSSSDSRYEPSNSSSSDAVSSDKGSSEGSGESGSSSSSSSTSSS